MVVQRPEDIGPPSTVRVTANGQIVRAKTLRLTPEMWADLERIASREHRSVAQQITHLLERALSEQPA